MQDTGKYRINTMDQFYTDISVSKKCIDDIHQYVESVSDYLWIEPSAGSGSFFHNIPTTYDKIGIDIEPKSDELIKTDFLTWRCPDTEKKIIVFGNPPFGRQSTLAKAFIQKSCEFADVIAFILPKSFTKPSMYNAFDMRYHCIYTSELDKNSFIVNGDCKYDVPCVFQIWERRLYQREIVQKVDAIGFTYVKSSDTYHIALRRVGANAGRCYKNDGSQYSIQSHYFILFDNHITPHIDSVFQKINNHTFPSNTVGPRSLSKSEVNEVLNQIISEHASS
jgi:hypothetical protein